MHGVFVDIDWTSLGAAHSYCCWLTIYGFEETIEIVFNMNRTYGLIVW
jgi:hypothetical protein